MSAATTPQTGTTETEFQSSAQFTGSRPGYFFSSGTKGLGYYKDHGPNQNHFSSAEAMGIVTVTDEEEQAGPNREAEEKTSNDDNGDEPGEVHLDPLEDDDDEDSKGKTYQAESLCMNCEEQGLSTFYVTSIPHFRDIIISAFRCEHCGHSDTLVQPNSEIPTHGVRYKLQVTTPADLNRQVVKSAYCTITVPELGLVIPKESQESTLSTIEGILQKTTVALHDSNEARKAVDPEAAEKVSEFVKKLALTISGQVSADGILLERPFTFIVEDPSGDSHIQSEVVAPAVDPQLSRETFVRSEHENKVLGLFTDEQLGVERTKPFKVGCCVALECECVRCTQKAVTLRQVVCTRGVRSCFHRAFYRLLVCTGCRFFFLCSLFMQAPQGGTLTDNRIMEMYQRAEDLDLVRFECACPACHSTGENRMCTVTVPHFQVGLA